MAWSVNTHELAWAAGFFDGEGSTYLDPRPRLSVVQNDPYVLLRFQRAVGLGKLEGGKKIYGRATKPMWSLRVSGWRDVQAVVCLLWRWLSPQKQGQALAVLLVNLQLMSESPRYGGNRRSHPRCGEPADGHRVATCRACQRTYEAAYRDRVRAAQGGQ